MPMLTVEGEGSYAVPEGKRLVLALEDEAHVDQLHACGGNARCTTCRVEFVAGEPARMTLAEKSVLATATGVAGCSPSAAGCAGAAGAAATIGAAGAVPKNAKLAVSEEVSQGTCLPPVSALTFTRTLLNICSICRFG